MPRSLRTARSQTSILISYCFLNASYFARYSGRHKPLTSIKLSVAGSQKSARYVDCLVFPHHSYCTGKTFDSYSQSMPRWSRYVATLASYVLRKQTRVPSLRSYQTLPSSHYTPVADVWLTVFLLERSGRFVPRRNGDSRRHRLPQFPQGFLVRNLGVHSQAKGSNQEPAEGAKSDSSPRNIERGVLETILSRDEGDRQRPHDGT